LTSCKMWTQAESNCHRRNANAPFYH